MATIAVLVLSAHPAAAHPRFPAANAVVFHPSDPETILVRTTVGLLLTRDGGRQWDFLCGALTATKPTEDPAVLLTDTGSLVLGNFQGLYRSDPSLCQYAPPDGTFADEYVIDLDQSSLGDLVAATSTGGQDNALHRSNDEGVSWSQSGEGLSVLFETVAIAPSDPNRIYLTATVPPSPAGPGQALVVRSSDAGNTWESIPFEGDAAGATLDLLAVSRADPDLLYARLSKDHEQLLVSRDAGTSFEVLLVAAGVIGGLYVSDDGQRVLVGGPDIGLLESNDGGATFDVRNFDPDVNCLHQRGDALWVCDQRPDAEFQVGRSVDGGATFESVLRFQEARGPLTCGDDAVANACRDEWRDLLNDFDDAFTKASLPRRQEIHGGCTTAGGDGSLPSFFWTLVLLIASLAALRRRQRAATGTSVVALAMLTGCTEAPRSGATTSRQSAAAIELELVGSLNPARGSSWAGIWGYELQGREYALLSGEVGLVVIDITDPENPAEVERIQMPGGSVHRDVATHDHYAYVGGQQGADLFVIDLAGLPTGAQTVGQFREYRNAAHTLHLDQGLLFLNDSGGSCRILSLADPLNPELVSEYEGGECHDSHLQGDLFFAAQGGDGRFDLVDLSDPSSPQRIGRTDEENIYAHSVAVPADGDTMYAFEEANTKDLLIYDIEDRTSPQLIGEFEMPGAAIIHNGWIRGDLLFIAYYEEGLVVLDISDRADPVVAAQYDTYERGTDGDYLGGWNVYVDLPSRLVLMSDTQTGLWIFRVQGEVVQPPPTPDAGTPDGGAFVPVPVDGGGQLPSDGGAPAELGHFIRGDVTADGVVDREDAVALLREVVLGQPTVRCASAGDLDDDGDVDRDDYVQLRGLARGRYEFEVPAPSVCGADPTPDSLGCTSPCSP